MRDGAAVKEKNRSLFSTMLKFGRYVEKSILFDIR